MKKHLLSKLLLLSALLGGVNSVLAETTIGSNDFQTAYLGAHSEQLLLKDGQKAMFTFKNYGNQVDNFANWVACVSNDVNFGEEGYSPYIYLRADNWENIQDSNSGLESNFNWSTFKNDMYGATVVETFTYKNGTMTVRADILKSNGSTTYFEQFSKAITGDVRVWLSVDHSYLTLMHSKVFDADAPVVGNVLNTTGYEGASSDKHVLKEGQRAIYTFTNYSNKVENWNNFIACVSTGNDENLIYLRADNYDVVQGNSDNITSNFNWGTFKDELDGASVIVTYTYLSGNITVRADITAENSQTRYEYITKAATGDAKVWLTLEKSHIVIEDFKTEAVKTISEAGWATYCSPNALDFSKEIENLDDAFIVIGGSNGVLVKTSVIGSTVPANTGLLLKGEGVCYIPVIETSSTDLSANKLVGCNSKTLISPNTGYVLLATPSLGFYKNNNNFNVGANTAYLPVDFDASSARFSFFCLDSETTSIQAIEKTQHENGIYFDLQGRSIVQPSKGLYIVNGKKVVIK